MFSPRYQLKISRTRSVIAPHPSVTGRYRSCVPRRVPLCGAQTGRNDSFAPLRRNALEELGECHVEFVDALREYLLGDRVQADSSRRECLQGLPGAVEVVFDRQTNL